MKASGQHVESVVELDGLSVQLGGRAILTDLRTRMSGRAIGLLGPNGAGKTTLLRTLLDFFPPSAGTATVLGQSITGNGKGLRAEIGYMPESDAFIANLTVVRSVRYMAELTARPGPALERADQALSYVGLARRGTARSAPLRPV